MLDGLDEANENDSAEAIVRDTLARTCSVLVLSRPHNLGDLRSKVDVETECLGLNGDQLKAYVRREVPDALDELIQFLKQSPLVWEVAMIHVNVQIICTLWNSEQRRCLKEWKYVSLKSLYTSIVEYAWQRFKEKTQANTDRQLLFSSLEVIAFTSISQNKVEISPVLVMQHSQGSTTCKLLLDSGFLLFHQKGQVFQFAHLSFHEFFAGRCLAKKLRGTEREIKKAKKYIAECKYYDTNRVTLSFMTQCYFQEDEDDEEEDCIGRLKQLLSILDEDPVEAIGFQHTLLKMRTLDAFLTVFGNCVEDIRSDGELQRLVQFATTTLDTLLNRLSTCIIGIGIENPHLVLYDEIMEELGRMPSLFACLPELLVPVFEHCDRCFREVDTSRIARIASYAPDQRLKIMPTDIQGANSAEYSRRQNDLFFWSKMFTEFGPKCAVHTFEQLKTACQHQNKEIRIGAFKAVPYFLKVLPEQEDLHSLCMEAMKDTSRDVRAQFLEELSQVVFEPNSVAANLAWTLTVEATREGVTAKMERLSAGVFSKAFLDS